MSWGQRQARRIKGDRFISVSEFVDWISDGGWVWWRHKAYHPEVIKSLQLRIITNSIARSDYASLHKAVRNPEYLGRTWDQVVGDAMFNARRFMRERNDTLRNFHLANGARTEP